MPTYAKTGGGISRAIAGGRWVIPWSKRGGGLSKSIGGGVEQVLRVSPLQEFDPDYWVKSLFRALKGYVLASLDTDIYDIEFGFPSADDLGKYLPFDKTLIHFEVDDIQNPVFGFGDNIVDAEYDNTDGTIVQHEARQHIVNFDVGIWASARSGGVTARLVAYQTLNDLFVGSNAFTNLKSIGIELRSFSGGSFIKDETNDVSVFRVANMTLEVKVFSRRIWAPIPYIGTVVLNPQLTTEDGVVIPGT